MLGRRAVQPCELLRICPRLRARARPSSSIRPRGRQLSALPMQEALELLLAKKDLTKEQAEGVLTGVLQNMVPEQVAAFLVLLRAKGETPAEVAGLASAMRETAVTLHTQHKVVDITGTGGDGIGSVNISTGACVIAAAAGAKVAKHGNRSVSSLCGSADVLEALGVAMDLGADAAGRCLDDVGITFMFAPMYHPAMKAMKDIRGALKVRTAFNILGPLLNPAHAAYGLVGVYSPDVSDLMAGALMELGMKKALVVHSMGLDELTPMGPAFVVEVAQGECLKRYWLDPKEVGISRCEVKDLQGGDAQLNAQILRDVFGGARGAVADALNLNAGYALAACEVASNPQEGVMMAREVQESGQAAAILEKWISVSQQLREMEKMAGVAS